MAKRQKNPEATKPSEAEATVPGQHAADLSGEQVEQDKDNEVMLTHGVATEDASTDDLRLQELEYDSGRAEAIAVEYLGHDHRLKYLTDAIDQFAQDEAQKAVKRADLEGVMAEERRAFEERQVELTETARQANEQAEAIAKQAASQPSDADRAALTLQAENARTWESQDHFDHDPANSASPAGDAVVEEAAARDLKNKEDMSKE